MSLNIKVIKKKDYVYVAELAGSLDTESYLDLESQLKEILDEKTKAVIIDMAGVSYISSAGIGIIMWARKTLQSSNASFALTNLQPQIKKVFDAMKIMSIVDIFDDMPEADKYIDQIIKDEIKKAKG